MNIEELHEIDGQISAVKMFTANSGILSSIQLGQDCTLKEHVTNIPALLLCVSGYVVYQDEKDQRVELRSGDYFNIEVGVKHWLNAKLKSQLLLLK